jgi:hypothetical protein
MADTTGYIVEAPDLLFGTGDPVNFYGIIMPLTAVVTAPPLLTIISPPAATVISNVAPVVFSLVDDTNEFALLDLWVGFGRTPKSYELAYDGELQVFPGNFSGSSKLDNVFTLVRTGGFPYRNRVRLRANVVDSGGNVVVISA